MIHKNIRLTLSHSIAILLGGCIGFAIGFFTFISKLSNDLAETREWLNLGNYQTLLEEIDNENIPAVKDSIYTNLISDLPVFEMRMESETVEKRWSYRFDFWQIASHMAKFPYDMEDSELNDFKNEWMNNHLEFPQKGK